MGDEAVPWDRGELCESVLSWADLLLRRWIFEDVVQLCEPERVEAYLLQYPRTDPPGCPPLPEVTLGLPF